MEELVKRILAVKWDHIHDGVFPHNTSEELELEQLREELKSESIYTLVRLIFKIAEIRYNDLGLGLQPEIRFPLPREIVEFDLVDHNDPYWKAWFNDFHQKSAKFIEKYPEILDHSLAEFEPNPSLQGRYSSVPLDESAYETRHIMGVDLASSSPETSKIEVYQRLPDGSLIPAIPLEMCCEYPHCRISNVKDYIRNEDEKDGSSWDNEPICLCLDHSVNHRPWPSKT